MRALLRRQIWRPIPRPFLRYQHDLPHKEYFQNPGQMPLPDATPYTPPPTFPSSPSYFRRGVKSVAWATLFGSLGLVGGVSLLTWDYLQPEFEPGSEEDQEILDAIEVMMDSHPLVQGLREGGWTEKVYKPPQNRLLQTLSGTQGLTMRGFQLDSGYTILVFYTGSGLEGWPDVIHGGLITSLFDEAALLHMAEPNVLAWTPQYQVVVDFKESIRPGEIYSILLPPASMEPLDSQGHAGSFLQVAVHGMLMRMELAPKITVEVNEDAKTRSDVVQTLGASDTIFAEATIYFVAPVGEDGLPLTTADAETRSEDKP